MEYTGRLYGKIGNKYFDTGRTSDEFDSMQKRIISLQSQIDDDENEDNMWEDDDEDDYDREDDGTDFLNFNCTCGAWVWSTSLHRFSHIADCCCGSNEPF